MAFFHFTLLQELRRIPERYVMPEATVAPLDLSEQGSLHLLLMQYHY